MKRSCLRAPVSLLEHGGRPSAEAMPRRHGEPAEDRMPALLAALRRIYKRRRIKSRWEVLVHRCWRMRYVSFYSERAIDYLKEGYNEAAPLDQKLEVVDLDQFAEGVLEERAQRSAVFPGKAWRERTVPSSSCSSFMWRVSFSAGVAERRRATWHRRSEQHGNASDNDAA